MSTPKPRNTELELKAIAAARILRQEAAGGGFSLNSEDFGQAQQQFGYRVDELRGLVWNWQILGEFPQPLGDNPVGKAVARRFTDASGRFVATLGDYQGKLGDAHGAAGEVLRSLTAVDSAEADNYTKLMGGGAASGHADMAAVPLGGFGLSSVRTLDFAGEWDAPEWTPADRVDWRTYTSQQLHAFATEGNNPGAVFGSIQEWRSNEGMLTTSTSDVKNEVGRMMAAWQGGAANAARGALEPLAEWGNDGAGNANRLHRDLEKAGEAAARLKTMPGPVEEPTMFEMLHTQLMGSPAEQIDMRERVRHAQQVKAEQVRYMEQYESTMTTVYDSLPNFHLAPVAVVDDPGGPPVPGPYPDPGGPGNPVAVPPGRRPEESRPPAAAVAGTPGPRDGTPELPGTVASRATDLATLPPGGLPPAAAGGGESATRGGPLAAGGFVAGGFGPGNQGAGSQGRAGDGRSGNLGRGSGEGRGANGPNRGGTPVAAEGAPARRGPGTMPAGGAQGRWAEGAEDIEHERPSYLVEQDPQGLFGTDERTAPPVIG